MALNHFSRIVSLVDRRWTLSSFWNKYNCSGRIKNHNNNFCLAVRIQKRPYFICSNSYKAQHTIRTTATISLLKSSPSRTRKLSGIHTLIEDKQKAELYKHSDQQKDFASLPDLAKGEPSSFAYSIISDTIGKGSSKTTTILRHDDIELVIDGNRLAFNLIWLRDSCRCAKCLHRHSRQRLTDLTKSQGSTFQIESCKDTKFSDRRKIQVDWSDGHSSFYDIDWLLDVSRSFECFGSYLNQTTSWNNDELPIDMILPKDDYYSSDVFQDGCSNRKLWKSEDIGHLLEPVEYANLIGDINKNTSAISSIVRQLYQLGLAKIINVPCERDQLLEVARLLAYERPTGYGTTFDVVIEPTDRINLAYSAIEFDLHCDLAYRECLPGVQLLHCLNNSVKGGESYFCDAFNVANQLKKKEIDYYKILSRMPVTFSVIDPYRDVKFRRQWPIITLDYLGQLEKIHYSPWMLPPLGHLHQIKLFYEAYNEFSAMLHNNTNKYITKMAPGDLFIFQNGRVLHGRNKYDPEESRRFLQGCYMDWDEIECLYEKYFT